ncbi:MAG: hypothetical protein AAFO77_05920 [Pseudomonadota bacterium]
MAPLAAFALSAPAFALDVPFTGVIDNPDFCLIQVVRPGTLGQNSSGSQLSSYNPGGESGQAIVRSFGFGYQLQALHSNVWNTSPIADNQQTTFTPFFSGTPGFRGLSFPDRPGTQAVTLPFFSRTDIDVNLIATHNGGGFPSGNYTTDVILLCD